MIRHLALLLTAWLLSGCATLNAPEAPSPLSRDGLSAFQLTGRFVLRLTPAGQAPQSSAGRIDWTHAPRSDHMLLASPLGHTVAAIDITEGHARLRTSDGRTMASDDAEQLIAEATGQRLPLQRLSRWVLGQGGPDARIESDQRGRPTQLYETGWQVAYAYDDDRPEALPARLTITFDSEIELKLRIESWKDQP